METRHAAWTASAWTLDMDCQINIAIGSNRGVPPVMDLDLSPPRNCLRRRIGFMDRAMQAIS
ncbi:hypothetical protein LGM55_23780 [Burkholderia contaminans]|nr:hypothetical protein [Burkholderia contaminans]